MSKIHNLIAALLIFTSLAHSFVLDEFFKDQSDKMNTFFKNQFNQVEKAVNSSYEEAVKVQMKVNDYIEDQKQKITSDANNYVESVRKSGRNIVDKWTFMPTEDPMSKLDNPDEILSVPSIITRNGYVCETHTVFSQGYLLNIHRIPKPKSGGKISKKTVILQHGLFASSADWILNGPEKSLAYNLADLGYDVWMTNIRGNRYSKEHAWYKENTKEYWNFSWNEVAYYDIPAVIDYIRNTKGDDAQIAYIGHSMGTTILFTMLSLRPEYNEKLTVGVALAPEIFLSNMASPMKSLATIASNLAHTEMAYGKYEYIPKNSFLGQMNQMCNTKSIDVSVCSNIVFYLCGEDQEQFDPKLLPLFLSNLGTGTSWKTALHMSQMVLSGKFQQFDYGFADGNQRMYGSDNPPEYDLSKVTLNVALFWAQNDLLSNELDVRKLHETLPDTTQMYMVPFPRFNHIDYLWAKDAPSLVNEKVMEVLGSSFRTQRQVEFRLSFK